MPDASVQMIDDEIVMEIEIMAPPEKVFRALTDPQQLIVWWGEEQHCQTVHWEMDLRVGGQWRSKGRDDTCGEWETWGVIIELHPPWALAYTWDEQVEYRPSVKQTTVRYQLETTDQGTRVRLTHKGFSGKREAFESYRGGWPVVLDLLRTHLEAKSNE
jgi:uncharacterized protein YndB with AHSA1/START domain